MTRWFCATRQIDEKDFKKKERKMKDERKLSVGIAGYGAVGKRRRHFIDQHPRLRTTAVCDQKFKETGIMPDGVKQFTNYRQLLEEPLDVLFVSLPNYLAAEVTI